MQSVVEAERRSGRCEAEQRAVTMSLMYASYLPLWKSYIKTHSLYRTRAWIGNQWSSRSPCDMWSRDPSCRTSRAAAFCTQINEIVLRLATNRSFSFQNSLLLNLTDEFNNVFLSIFFKNLKTHFYPVYFT